jgi:hypothetical protein
LTAATASSAPAGFGVPFKESVAILGWGFRLLSLLREREKNIMEQFQLSSDSASSDLIPFALAVHAILNGLPVTIRSQNYRGVQIEDGEVKSRNYTGPILERVLAENVMIKTRPQAGEYMNVPVIVAPIQDSRGSAIAAIGVVDITGIFDLADLISQQSQIISQLRYCAVPTSK